MRLDKCKHDVLHDVMCVYECVCLLKSSSWVTRSKVCKCWKRSRTFHASKVDYLLDHILCQCQKYFIVRNTLNLTEIYMFIRSLLSQNTEFRQIDSRSCKINYHGACAPLEVYIICQQFPETKTECISAFIWTNVIPSGIDIFQFISTFNIY